MSALFLTPIKRPHSKKKPRKNLIYVVHRSNRLLKKRGGLGIGEVEREGPRGERPTYVVPATRGDMGAGPFVSLGACARLPQALADTIKNDQQERRVGSNRSGGEGGGVGGVPAPKGPKGRVGERDPPPPLGGC